MDSDGRAETSSPGKVGPSLSKDVGEPMTSKPSIEQLLADSDRELGRFAWVGTFGDYLRVVTDNPWVSRLSHKLVHDAIMAEGAIESATGEPVYSLFENEIFGIDDTLDRIVQYFASSARRLEIRKRILLLLGPPAGGKSSIVALIKGALERYSRTEEGAVYAIKGCPMQEEPLHLIPHRLRPKLMEEFGVYIEGDLCPRCRYVLHTTYQGKVSEMPVTRVTFSELAAVGIGYYVATNPNPTDASLLVGSIDTANLEGDRLEVAGKAFRLDGELNVANRGLVEFVEIFKTDRHLLTTLLGLAQEQLIKMERFGSVYADEVVIAHSNEGDFQSFAADEHSEALRDRLIAIRIPYNLRVMDEVKIYQKMLKMSGLQDVHLPPLTLPVMSIFTVLSRLEPPARQGMPLIDKLRLYDGQMLSTHSLEDVTDMRRHHPNEGMSGISPRYVMNCLSAVAASPDVSCVSPLKAADSLWKGLTENVSLDDMDRIKYIGFIKDTVEEYKNRAIQEVQRAFNEGFEQSAADLLSEYLYQIALYVDGGEANERDMRDMEKHVGIADRGREKFRREIHQISTNLKRRGVPFDYTAEPRLKAAIEARLFPSLRVVERTFSIPRFAKQRVEWRRQRNAISKRLIESYGYCPRCANDLINYVVHVLRGKPVLKTPKNEGVDWLWDLNPPAPSPEEAST